MFELRNYVVRKNGDIDWEAGKQWQGSVPFLLVDDPVHCGGNAQQWAAL